VSAAPLAEIAAQRRTGLLDDQALRAVLHERGFEDGRAAAEALDQLLAADSPDLPAGEVLAGAAVAADPLRALINASRLAALPGRPACRAAPAKLAGFLGASQHMADLLMSRPELLADLGRPFEAASAPARHRAAAAGDDRERALRLAQQQDLLAIAWSDLVEQADVETVTLQLSRLADAVIAGAAAGLGADRQLAVLALGKLGGSELNYSSDIDLIFVRPDGVTDQASADRAARDLVRLIGRQTPEGHLYRVDMRLRPEGVAGQLTRTLSSSLQYYRQVGRPWERQMLTKARVVAECEGAGAAFLAGTRAWILECGLDAGAIRQFKRLKAVTEARAAQASDDRADIKHAPGGIRDIETIVQFLTLLHGQRHPGLLSPSTLIALERLRVAGAIDTLEAARLRSAYRFHRRVENLLQVLHHVQTHSLPADRRVLARLLRQRDVESLDGELAEHRQRVRQVFERHFARAFEETAGRSARATELVLDDRLDPERARAILLESGFARPDEALAVLRRAAAPVSRFLPASPRLRSTFASLAPALLERLALAPDPDGSLDRFEAMTRGFGAREILYAELSVEPRLLEALCDLAAGSPYLADLLANEPHIVDEFIDALLTGVRGKERRRRSLQGLDRLPGDAPWLQLSDHKRLETLCLGLLDLQDRLPVREVLAELSRLCIDVLRQAFEVVMAGAVRSHGEPTSILGLSARESAGMAVIALGKLGGLEANYASDADLIFVYSGDGQTEDGTPNTVFFSRVAEEFIARVGGMRGGPRLYRIDTRLRPEGAKGPLVTSLKALDAYYRSPRAALFERQALLKARVVAGDAELGQRVLQLVRATVRGLDQQADLATPLREMRARIEEKAHGHDLKRGIGGMVDVEFLTQYLQLRHGARRPALLVSETPRALEMLSELDVLPEDVALELRDTYLFFRRVETRLQLALGLDTKEVPPEPHALRVLALRLGYADTAEGDAGHLLVADLERRALETRERYDALLVAR